MKILERCLNEESLEERDCQDILRIYVNNRRVFSVHDGEPEDSNLSRDFNDCYGIVDMMKSAFNAGAAGEQLEITRLNVSFDEM